jgi:hypothetical protein
MACHSEIRTMFIKHACALSFFYQQCYQKHKNVLVFLKLMQLSNGEKSAAKFDS